MWRHFEVSGSDWLQFLKLHQEIRLVGLAPKDFVTSEETEVGALSFLIFPACYSIAPASLRESKSLRK
jgi:hypothetical protein